jgi:hypothetical protein
VFWEWLRQVTQPLDWSYDQCVAVFPSAPGRDAAQRMESYFHQVLDQDIDQYRNESQRPRAGQYLPLWKIRPSSYDGHPTPVHASVVDRMSEIMAHRQTVCIYHPELQQSKVLHIRGEQSTGYRLLIHFYAFVFL